MCKFLIVSVASCRVGRGVRVGNEAEAQVQEEFEGGVDGGGGVGGRGR